MLKCKQTNILQIKKESLLYLYFYKFMVPYILNYIHHMLQIFEVLLLHFKDWFKLIYRNR